MRKWLLSLVMATAMMTAAGQAFPTGPVVFAMGSGTIDITAFEGRPNRDVLLPEVQGSPFLRDEWCRGAVKLKDGRVANDAQLMFNIYQQILYFKQNDQMYEFGVPVQEFLIRYQDKSEPDSVTLHFRCGYPTIDSHSPTSFYEVLADGPLQLVKFHAKVFKDIKGGYIDARVRRFENKSQLYAVLPNSSMIRLDNNEKDLLKALPERTGDIQKIVDEGKLKLRNENHLRLLVLALNAQKTKS